MRNGRFGITSTLPRVDSLSRLNKWARKALVDMEVPKNPTLTLTELQKSSAEIGEPVGRTTIPAVTARPLW